MLLLQAPQSLTPWQCHALPFSPPPPSTSQRGRSKAPPPTPSYSSFSVTLVPPKLALTTTSISSIQKPLSKQCKSSSNNNEPRESSFLDEDGVVKDMDAYLNYLSLEYDSVWDTKPSWCQPWTITLTGILVIAGSWLILHSAIVTAAVLSLICAWWYIFLYNYPKAYLEMIEERRKRVTSGIEDTYGLGALERQPEGGDAGRSTN
ncbi:hypothetical protein ACH5RR_010656 [Cinchona calisaya]|uniref:DUF6737 domain-containing protein n=1 Tax=Cinchona calisaya TaxID=153742 RepID=A0ABD3AJM9_9GENT